MKHNKQYIIVAWDLDETIGNFVEIGVLCDALKSMVGRDLTSLEFYNILDLYPEIFRPNILNILNYLKQQKNKKKCHKVIIYTNNQGPKEWAQSIKGYLEYKLQAKLFDQIIAAYKIRGEHIELNRKSHMKNVPDLLRCTHLPQNSKICFLDDQYHADMKHEQVSYIYLKPYVHNFNSNEMINRFVTSPMGHNIQNPPLFRNKLLDFFNKYTLTSYNKTNIDYEIDKIISKQIMIYIKEFIENNSV
jgi:hypothetical protein